MNNRSSCTPLRYSQIRLSEEPDLSSLAAPLFCSHAAPQCSPTAPSMLPLKRRCPLPCLRRAIFRSQVRGLGCISHRLLESLISLAFGTRPLAKAGFSLPGLVSGQEVLTITCFLWSNPPPSFWSVIVASIPHNVKRLSRELLKMRLS